MAIAATYGDVFVVGNGGFIDGPLIPLDIGGFGRNHLTNMVLEVWRAGSQLGTMTLLANITIQHVNGGINTRDAWPVRLTFDRIGNLYIPVVSNASDDGVGHSTAPTDPSWVYALGKNADGSFELATLRKWYEFADASEHPIDISCDAAGYLYLFSVVTSGPAALNVRKLTAAGVEVDSWTSGFQGFGIADFRSGRVNAAGTVFTYAADFTSAGTGNELIAQYDLVGDAQLADIINRAHDASHAGAPLMYGLQQVDDVDKVQVLHRWSPQDRTIRFPGEEIAAVGFTDAIYDFAWLDADQTVSIVTAASSSVIDPDTGAAAEAWAVPYLGAGALRFVCSDISATLSGPEISHANIPIAIMTTRGVPATVFPPACGDLYLASGAVSGNLQVERWRDRAFVALTDLGAFDDTGYSMDADSTHRLYVLKRSTGVYRLLGDGTLEGLWLANPFGDQYNVHVDGADHVYVLGTDGVDLFLNRYSTNGTLLNTFTLGLPGGAGPTDYSGGAVSSDGKTYYYSFFAQNVIKVYNLDLRVQGTDIAVTEPTGLRTHPDGRLLVRTIGATGRLRVYESDLTTFTDYGAAESAGISDVEGDYFDQRKVWVANNATPKLDLVDLDTATVTLGITPLGTGLSALPICVLCEGGGVAVPVPIENRVGAIPWVWQSGNTPPPRPTGSRIFGFTTRFW